MSQVKKQSPITMRDVAKAAGVSIATISRTLSSPEKVSSSTRFRVEEAISHTGYTIQPIAPHTANNPLAILIIISASDLLYYADFLETIRITTSRNGYSSMIIYFDDLSHAAIKYLLLSKQICGLIFLNIATKSSSNLLNNLLLLPTVIINGYSPQVNAACINIDNLSAAFHAVSYLHQSGHHRIACLHGSEEIPCYRDRKQGYLQALKRWGIAIEKRYIIETRLTFLGGSEALRSLLALPLPPTAVFCHSDYQAVGVLWQAQQIGLSIPNNLAIIGFDNLNIAQYCNPTLTSVGYDKSVLAEHALALLVEQMKQKTSIPQCRQLKFELIIRETTRSV